MHNFNVIFTTWLWYTVQHWLIKTDVETAHRINRRWKACGMATKPMIHSSTFADQQMLQSTPHKQRMVSLWSGHKAYICVGAGMAQWWERSPPPMWPVFDSRTRRHMWVEFVVSSRPCSESFFSGTPVFPPSSKTNISKFQFDLEFEGHRFVSHTTVKCHPR